MGVRKGFDPTLRSVTMLYLTTLAHHVYGGVVFASMERLILALVFTALFVLTVWLSRHTAANRWARRAYWSLVVGFWIVLLGLYEGGFNHALYVVLRAGGASPETMQRLYPAGSDAVISDDVFFQATGVLTLVAAIWVAVTIVARRPTRMAVIRLDRFNADPAVIDELIARRNALVAAVKQATPGLINAQLNRVDDETWIDIWSWDTLAHARAAAQLAQSGQIPEAGAAFALTTNGTTEFADVVDKR